MNYIQLINRFWDLNMEKHFTLLEVAYYLYLLNVCNRGRWKEVFEVSNKDLIHVLSCTQGQLRIARNHLVDARLIVYYPGKMNRAVRYSINIPEYITNNDVMSHENEVLAQDEALSHDVKSMKREEVKTNTERNRQTVERKSKRHGSGNSENISE